MMDNCLASNSDTGGVGCDNMTMIVIGLLQGRTKEQWYEDIAKRVANGEGPCAPPEYAEFRGPGVHHRIDDSPDDIDMDLDSRFRPNNGNGNGGRIILLGDGTEVSTGDNDGEMFDNEDEDKDLDSQVNKYNQEANAESRQDREGTPGPQHESKVQVTESPSSVQTEKSDAPESQSEAPKTSEK
jgi:protein phosphatase 2C family protein 2/3